MCRKNKESENPKFVITKTEEQCFYQNESTNSKFIKIAFLTLTCFSCQI